MKLKLISRNKYFLTTSDKPESDVVRFFIPAGSGFASGPVLDLMGVKQKAFCYLCSEELQGAPGHV
jgi:hypothetical protein